MRNDRHPAGLVDPRDPLGERAEHRDFVFDPEGQKVTGPRRDLDARNDPHGAGSSRRKVAQRERAADVVVVSERDDIEADALRRVEDLLDRRKAVAKVAV
jgi:hypothetical protein